MKTSDFVVINHREGQKHRCIGGRQIFDGLDRFIPRTLVDMAQKVADAEFVRSKNIYNSTFEVKKRIFNVEYKSPTKMVVLLACAGYFVAHLLNTGEAWMEDVH